MARRRAPVRRPRLQRPGAGLPAQPTDALPEPPALFGEPVVPVDPSIAPRPPALSSPEASADLGALSWEDRPVEVRRSGRRQRTVSAYRKDGRTVVMVPARLSADEERRWVTAMLLRLDAQEERRRLDDPALLTRAAELSRRYLQGRARPSSVRWVTNQGSRWGSCTPASGSIRLSHRLQGMPEWVVDYVLVHELVHLLVPSHAPAFWRLAEAYPRTERARGYLEGVAAASGLEIAEGEDDVVDGGEDADDD